MDMAARLANTTTVKRSKNLEDRSIQIAPLVRCGRLAELRITLEVQTSTLVTFNGKQIEVLLLLANPSAF